MKREQPHYGIPERPYKRRAGMQPTAETEYQLDGVAHRFDGKCHADCENVL